MPTERPTHPASLQLEYLVRASLSLLGLSVLLSSGLQAQQSSRTEPVTGLRANSSGFHALVGARVITAPGQVLNNATIVIRDGLITAVGSNVPTPAGARVWDLKGHCLLYTSPSPRD